ncbi:hypothetical protein CH063_02476 [Colletotrichum higginsianum]|uniref:Uncharacterized protein n=1 Tax=Colletotrichum higginsianum (strain IMI 349063) TaxID=759273 RepID=H1VL52_COLHI|nr:uncharacterized protein CH63R_10848 [Colletotrichum higginsianum IMI 349063]OBR06728.1 hypothetical protein CH63R_10848 [Colletotrichum higginsianum IMI 349063]CCF40955.1 hypothetical protein CH063_02476 [Colletotrichum higginsianum]
MICTTLMHPYQHRFFLLGMGRKLRMNTAPCSAVGGDGLEIVLCKTTHTSKPARSLKNNRSATMDGKTHKRT